MIPEVQRDWLDWLWDWFYRGLLYTFPTCWGNQRDGVSATLWAGPRNRGLSSGCGTWSSMKPHYLQGWLCQGKLWLAGTVGTHAKGWEHIALEPRTPAACQATAGLGPRLWAPIVEGGFYAWTAGLQDKGYPGVLHFICTWGFTWCK